MPKLLKESLKTIDSYKMTSPHYEELLDILGDILILREEYRQKMPAVIFPVDDSLIEKKWRVAYRSSIFLLVILIS